MIKHVVTFSDNIQSLHAAAGVLWIAHHGGLTAFDPVRGAACKWTTRDGLPALPVLHVTTSGARIAAATPNGVAWCDDVAALAGDGFEAAGRVRWERGLTHPLGAGAYINGVAFVDGRIWGATGGGRIYCEGPRGFEIVELPVPQARLVRLLPLVAPRGQRRILILTNNNGALLLATGGKSPGLYQWAEEEGFASRYTTAAVEAGGCVAVAVHGAVQVMAVRRLVEHPDEVTRWGTVRIADYGTATEQNRIPALCAHGDSLYMGTASGLHRLPFAALDLAVRDIVTAEQVDDAPVRHLASTGETLWIAQPSTLGRWNEAGARTPRRAPVVLEAPAMARSQDRSAHTLLQFDAHESPAVVRSHVVPESRWRAATEIETRPVLALAASPETIAVGGEAGRVTLLRGGKWHAESVARMRRMPEVHALAWDADNGVFWAATRYGLYQHEDRGRWCRDQSFPGRSVHALAPWGGSVVALSNAGVHVYVQSQWSEVDFPAGPAPAFFVLAASERALAMSGRAQSGVWIWRAGAARPEPAAIAAGRANCMAWGEGRDLWLGTDRGLVRWTGEAAASFVWNDERRDHITAVLEHAGRLYVGSQAGVWVAPVRNLHAAAGNALESLGERIGLLQGLPDPNVTKLLVHDSTVWVGTQGGLALLD